MRAMVLQKPSPAADKPLALLDLPDPRPMEGELVLRVEACAVCRTDLQICEGDLAARALPIVPGHQAVGLVEAVGEGVSEWRVGDRAGVGWLGETCGVCAFCGSARENLCERARFTGWDRNGGFSERMAVDASFALRVPPTLAADAAAPLLCGGVIGYRSLKVSGIRPGGRLGLYGFGGSATLAIQVARHWGCEVFVCTRSVKERERATRLGAVWTGGYDDTPPASLEAAVTFAPSGDVVIAALRALGRGGTVAINAIHLDRIPTFSYDHLWWERQLRSVANFTRRDAAQLLELAERIPLVTTFERHPLAAANDALLRLADGRVEGAAVLVCGGAGLR
jgi:propanol-preferring alcohol dehydrogenase